jgi:hypothetical protein
VAGNPDPSVPGDGGPELELESDLESQDAPDGEEAEDGEDLFVEDADDEGDGDGDDGRDGSQERQAPAQNVRRSSRPNPRQRLRSENTELRSQLTEVQRQLQELARQRQQPSPQEIAEAQRREEEALSMMTPVEMGRYFQQQTNRQVQSQVQQIQAALFDRTDKQEYDRIVEARPTLRKFEAKVEELRAQSPGVPRRWLLAAAIGDAALNNESGARTRSSRQTEEQRRRQAARPSNGRGDVPNTRSRGRQPGNFEHLRNVVI